MWESVSDWHDSHSLESKDYRLPIDLFEMDDAAFAVAVAEEKARLDKISAEQNAAWARNKLNQELATYLALKAKFERD